MVYLVMFLLLVLAAVVFVSIRINKVLVLRCIQLKEKLSDSEKLVAELQYVSSCMDAFDSLEEAVDSFNAHYEEDCEYLYAAKEAATKKSPEEYKRAYKAWLDARP